MNAYAFRIDANIFPPAGMFSNFGQLATKIVVILTSVAGALSFIFIIIAGIKFVTSSGDEKKLASAQATLTYAIIGIVVTILALVIVEILQTFLKSSVTIT